MSSGANFTLAQTVEAEAQIEIVNQDGEKVELENAPRRVLPNADQAAADSGKDWKLVERTDDKMIIAGADGQQKEIDLRRARSVSIQQSAQSVMKDGKIQTVTGGTATVVAADGVRYEIDLGDQAGGGVGDQLGGNGLVVPKKGGKRSGKTFMIGVHCTKVPDALRAHLRLDEESGLLVKHVGNGSPAATAGLQPHDVLLFAEDHELQTPADLVEAVQKAGKNKTPVSLTLVRGGKEIGVDITPNERMGPQLSSGFPGGFKFRMGGLEDEFGKFEMQEFGPGVIVGDIPDDLMGDMREQLLRVNEEMKQMREQMKQRFDGGQ